MEIKEKQEKLAMVRAFLELSCKVGNVCNLSNRLSLFRELDNANGDKEKIRDIEEEHPEIHFYRALRILEGICMEYAQEESMDYTESDLEKISHAANKIWTCICHRSDFNQAIENFIVKPPFVDTELSDSLQEKLGIYRYSAIDKDKYGDIAGIIETEVIKELLEQ